MKLPWFASMQRKLGLAAPFQSTGLKAEITPCQLADVVMDACKDNVDFKFLYPLETPLR